MNWNFISLKMNAHILFDLTRYFLICSLLTQSFEMLKIAKVLQSTTHPWNWKNIKTDFEIFPIFIKMFFDKIYSNSFENVIYIQLATCFFLLFFLSPYLILVLISTTLLICLRFRGVFNGGSDYMTMTVLLGLLISSIITSSIDFGLIYIAIQSMLSYFIAGIVKLKNPQWRNGLALKTFLKYSNYFIPNFIKTNSENKKIILFNTWLVIFWEFTFPLALLNIKLLTLYLIIGFFFHITNFISFGLNRFIWAWLASYPALFYIHLKLVH